MCRDLLVLLIAKKATLNRELHDLTIRTGEIEQECHYCPPELEIGLTERLAQAKEEVRTAEAKLKRAHTFGRLYTKDLCPSFCMVCFIDHDQSTQMKEIESTLGNGIRQFKCEKCSFELRVNPGITRG